MTEVCTVFAPRPEHPKWRDDYRTLLSLQKRTAERFGHRHTVVTDCAMTEFNTIDAALPLSLMRALLVGMVRRLEMPVESDLVLVDADCLVARSLDEAFVGADFDLGLTARNDPVSPINNGAMYVPHGGARKALGFFLAALDRCGDHWGGDQEAISQVATPVGQVDSIAERAGASIKFLDILTHAVVPKTKGVKHERGPYVVHFKGETKDWAETYARKFILAGEKSSAPATG